MHGLLALPTSERYAPLLPSMIPQSHRLAFNSKSQLSLLLPQPDDHFLSVLFYFGPTMHRSLDMSGLQRQYALVQVQPS